MMAHTVGYKPGGPELAFFEPCGDCVGYAQVVIKDVPPHPSARFGFKQGVDAWKVIWV